MRAWPGSRDGQNISRIPATQERTPDSRRQRVNRSESYLQHITYRTFERFLARMAALVHLQLASTQIAIAAVIAQILLFANVYEHMGI